MSDPPKQIDRQTRQQLYRTVRRSDVARLLGRKVPSLQAWLRRHGLPAVGEQIDLGSLLPTIAARLDDVQKRLEAAESAAAVDVVHSRTALGRALGVPRRTASDMVAHPAWPFGADAPWPVDSARRWREITLANGSTNGTDDETEAELRKRLLHAQVAKAERENERLAEQLIDRDEVKTELKGILATLRSGLMAAAQAFPRTMQSQGMLRDGKRGDAAQLSESMFRQLAEQLKQDLRRLIRS